MIIWLTGIPCSGKTTIHFALAECLRERGHSIESLDGDDLRASNFSKGIGFSVAERKQHLLRVAYMAHRLDRWADFVICSFVSPSEDVRRAIGADVMIWCECPPHLAAERDVKGMWAKARAGEIKDFTGHDAPYDPPHNPDLKLLTGQDNIKDCVSQVLRYIKSHSSVSV